MKKPVSLLCALILLTTLLAGCAASPEEEAVTIRVGALTGPTAMGMVSLMEQNEKGDSLNDYAFTLAGSADMLTPDLLRGDLDMAAIPANLAAVLYERTEGELYVLAVNTLGVLYLVEAGGETVQSMEDLNGQTIYATGKGSTPEYTLRYLLNAHQIDPDTDVNIEWQSEPNEAVARLSQGGGIAMLPQPYVTVAQGQVEGLGVALDLTEEWGKLSDEPLITGVLVARKDFVDAHPKATLVFLAEYEASISFVQNNIAEAAALIEEFDILKATVAEKALPFCNITFLMGGEMKSALESYLEVLYEQNPEAVGGQLPKDTFYYLP